MDGWAPELREYLTFVFFEDIYRLKQIPSGCYIFTDHERLDDQSRKLIHGFRQRLADQGLSVQILNDPLEFLDRYAFLKALKEAGVNRFDVFPCQRERADDFTYPIFFRELAGHGATEIELYDDAQSFRAEYDRLEQAQGRASVEANYLVIEYQDTSSDDGVFRKYSYMKVGPRLIPRHIVFSQNWVVK